MPAVTSTVGIYPSRVFIRRFYYTFVNTLSDFHTLKNINSFLKRGRLTIEAFYIGLSRPAVRNTVTDDLVWLGYTNIIIQTCPSTIVCVWRDCRRSTPIILYENRRKTTKYSSVTSISDRIPVPGLKFLYLVLSVFENDNGRRSETIVFILPKL